MKTHRRRGGNERGGVVRGYVRFEVAIVVIWTRRSYCWLAWLTWRGCCWLAWLTWRGIAIARGRGVGRPIGWNGRVVVIVALLSLDCSTRSS